MLFYSSGLDGCQPMDMYLPFVNKVGWHPIGERIAGIFVVLLKPFSRGRVSLRSTHPNEFPRVEVNAFGDERDLQRLIRGIRLANELLNVPAVKVLTTYRFGGSFSERLSALYTFNRIICFEPRATKITGSKIRRDELRFALECRPS